MQVTINITRANVIADMRIKSQQELAPVVDDRERYIAEIGTEKLEEVNQCITDASVEVSTILLPFLTGTAGSSSATDNYDTANLVYNLSVAELPSPNFAADVTKAVHAYIVDSALAKYYLSVSRGQLAEAHAARLQALSIFLRNLIYYRPMP